MLNSLYIRNYRNLKSLKLDSLDQVNLITGKNNTGKSSLLEAILIYASKGNLQEIAEVIESHGEYLDINNSSTDNQEAEYGALSSLFHNRIAAFESEDAISVGEILKSEHGDVSTAPGTVALKFLRFIDEKQKDENGIIISRRKIIEEGTHEDNYEIGFNVIVKGGFKKLLTLGSINFRGIGIVDKSITDNFQFIKTGNFDREINGKLFDNIALTNKEKYVVEALKIIEPSTERIAFIEKNKGRNRERTAIIKLENIKETYPLKSMGDGINRVLTIILALVNSENGFLMIDEFENGLHYTAQEQLWKIIFKLSKDLNVQIFATTHSEDCISGFQRTLNHPQNNVKGKLIRLDNIDGVIQQTQFSSDELRIANEQDIEVR